MAVRSLTQRVEILEQKVGDLQELPARMTAVESQILQLREETHVEFSAIRSRFDGVDQRLDGADQRFVAIDKRFDAIDKRFDAIDRRFDVIDQRFEETRRHMQMLHEDLVTRISLIREGGR